MIGTGSLPRAAVRAARTFAATVGALGPAHAGLAYRYAMGVPFPAGGDREHLLATLAWLCKAQDITGGAGVSAVFSLRSGWAAPYPETSGYILNTFLACSDYLSDPALEARAVRIGDWEIAIQAPTGGVYSDVGRPQTRVFNTGQVILGWCGLFERTGDARYLDAARRGGDYLARIQEADGTWQVDTHCGARTYHARTDWGLLRLSQLTGDTRYAEAARRNLRWVLRQQPPTGGFMQCGFQADDPLTHAIDYTLVGLLESALIAPHLFDRSPAALIASSADAICDVVERSSICGVAGMIPASFDANWHSRDDHSCLTGNAQLACTLLRLHRLTANRRFADCARSLIAAVKHTQVIRDAPAPIRGGIPGSFPMCRGYHANSFPNWSAKFFADALLASLSMGTAIGVTPEMASLSC